MFEVVVIGYGNSLREDDGFGPVVVEQLALRVSDPTVELLTPMTLTPELAATLARARSAIFVDACATLGPGEVEHRAISATEDADVSLVHFLTPQALLLWTERLYGVAPHAEIWLVGSEKTGLSEALTPCVAARVADVVAAIEQRIRRIMSANYEADGTTLTPV